MSHRVKQQPPLPTPVPGWVPVQPFPSPTAPNSFVSGEQAADRTRVDLLPSAGERSPVRVRVVRAGERGAARELFTAERSPRFSTKPWAPSAG